MSAWEDLPSKLSLTTGDNINYYKDVDHPFELSVQVCSLLGQSEVERKTFLRGCKKGGYIVRLPPSELVCHKRWKVSPFVKCEKILPLLCFFIRLPYI